MRRFCRNIIGLESLGGGGVWQEKYKCKCMEAGKRETIMELWTCKVPERTSRRYRAAGRQGWVRRNWDFTPQGWSFPGGSSGEESACQCRRWRFELWIGKIPGEGNDNPLQYSCLRSTGRVWPHFPQRNFALLVEWFHWSWGRGLGFRGRVELWVECSWWNPRQKWLGV